MYSRRERIISRRNAFRNIRARGYGNALEQTYDYEDEWIPASGDQDFFEDTVDIEMALDELWQAYWAAHRRYRLSPRSEEFNKIVEGVARKFGLYPGDLLNMFMQEYQDAHIASKRLLEKS